MDGYLIPKSATFVEYEIKKSRFIGYIDQADSAETAKEKIQKIRERYPDASHHCWAFQTENPGSSRSIGCSDDGEPHGSAGKPMLNLLMHSEIGETVAVVVRYYGGVKLGTGGLARAYSEGVRLALEKAKTRKKIDWFYGEISFDYCHQMMIEKILTDEAAELLKQDFQDVVMIQFRVNKTKVEELNKKLKNLSQGKIAIQSLEY